MFSSRIIDFWKLPKSLLYTSLSSFSCFFPFLAERETLEVDEVEAVDDECLDKDLGVSSGDSNCSKYKDATVLKNME